ncbi:MAG: alcohol dehydrogenase catalytic domain-containing protein [Dehalococcoidia bacterium]|nr:alcohol dehydrogenase catalytic domain-containing protein [Dehalococcoidia bacterium]
MRQLTCVRPGVCEWLEVAEPQIQGGKEALVHPVFVARCDVDLPMLRGQTPIPMPIALGHEFIAEILELGDEVAGLRRGQLVVVPFQISCGECDRCRRGVTNSCASVPLRSQYGFGAFGGNWGAALSDRVRVPFAEGMLVPVPDGVEPAAIASADNLCDGWRTVGPYLQESPEVSVLVVGGGAQSVGLYAAAIASALGASRVDYVDDDAERLALAESVGANPLEAPPPKRLGPYRVTVDASANPVGLACALRSVEPGGVCTSVGIYFAEETPVPLLEMYTTGVTLVTGRVNARTCLPHVLDLVKSGRLHPEVLTTRIASWEEAADAFLDPSPKVLITR